MTARAWIYAALSAVGLVATWYWNLRFMSEQGGAFSVADFLAGGYANAAAASLTNDLGVACAAFLVWLFAEARRLAMRHAWVFVVLTFGVAFAFSFPLFLCLRERRLAELEAVG